MADQDRASAWLLLLTFSWIALPLSINVRQRLTTYDGLSLTPKEQEYLPDELTSSRATTLCRESSGNDAPEYSNTGIWEKLIDRIELMVMNETKLTSDWFRMITVSTRLALCNRWAIFLTHCLTLEISARPQISFNSARLRSTACRYSNALSNGWTTDWRRIKANPINDSTWIYFEKIIDLLLIHSSKGSNT